MAIDNNPLKQYFRRPAIYLRLPSGGKSYSSEVLDMPENGEIPVYPMTAIDDITAKTPDALFNGLAVVEIIKSCVPAFKDPWKITSVDLDAVLIAMRAASAGNDMEIMSTCPKCEEESKYGINLVGLLTQMKSGDYDTELEINDLLVKLRPLTYKEITDISTKQFEMQRVFRAIAEIEDGDVRAERSKEALKAVTKETMAIVAKSVMYIKTPDAYVAEPEFILDFVEHCDKRMYEAIKTKLAALRESTEIKPLKIKCVECAHDYEQSFSLNISDFFV